MLIGQHINHYRIDGRLGQGAMGEVYAAFDTRLGRRVALKILADPLTRDEEHCARFEREARAIAALNHSNIVTIHSVEQAGELRFFTMELVEGKTLGQLIPERGMPTAELLRLARPLTEAVAAAHRAGITHRDLKPENIMIDRGGRLKVLDFGVAKSRHLSSGAAGGRKRDDSTGDEFILGTAAYMAPEQARGGAADPRSDVFALGILLYLMASGKRPFSGDSQVAVLFSILNDTPVSLSDVRADIPRSLARIVDRCLAKDPERRFQNASDLAREIARIEVDDELFVPETEAPAARSFPWAIVVPVALLSLAVLAIAITFRIGRSPGAMARASSRASSHVPSVAVLPFANLDQDPADEYFADGITEEIISKLSRIRGLEVASITSVLRFKGSELDPREIARQLGVDHLLVGSIRKDGDRVRVTARLLGADSGFQLWSEDFDGDLDDVFGVQEQVALRIAEALDLQLTPGEREAVEHRFTSNPRAYDAYLRGRALLEYFADPAKLEAAHDHFERALELDPSYPLALVGMSRVEAQFHRNIDPAPERLVRAEELATRALAIDPGIAEAHLALGQVLANRYRYREAAARFRQAIAIEPRNAYAWDLLSWALAYQQPPDLVGAEEAARRAIGLQASLIGAHYHLGRALLLQDRFEEAIAAFEQSRSLDPNFESADFGLAQVYVAMGEYERALAKLDGLEALARSPVVPVQIAFAHAGLGHREAALQALARAFELGYGDLDALERSPHLLSLRDDPAFEALLEARRTAF